MRNSFSTSSTTRITKRKWRRERETWRVLEGSLEGESVEERQSATARRKGSGSFLTPEDLRRETPINCCGGREGLKLEDIIGFGLIGFGISVSGDESGSALPKNCTFDFDWTILESENKRRRDCTSASSSWCCFSECVSVLRFEKEKKKGKIK